MAQRFIQRPYSAAASKEANGLTRYSFSTRAALSASFLAAAKRVRSFLIFTLRARRRAISRLRSIRPIGCTVNLSNSEQRYRESSPIHSRGQLCGKSNPDPLYGQCYALPVCKARLIGACSGCLVVTRTSEEALMRHAFCLSVSNSSNSNRLRLELFEKIPCRWSRLGRFWQVTSTDLPLDGGWDRHGFVIFLDFRRATSRARCRKAAAA